MTTRSPQNTGGGQATLPVPPAQRVPAGLQRDRAGREAQAGLQSAAEVAGDTGAPRPFPQVATLCSAA